MSRDPSHWLIEDDNQSDYPLPEDEVEGFNHNEFGPREFEPYDDENCYEMLIPQDWKENKMKFTEDMIKAAIMKGYSPITKKRMVLKFKCPSCNKVRMIKFSPPGNTRKRVHSCVCGYRKRFTKEG